jgi:hypothetical protein
MKKNILKKSVSIFLVLMMICTLTFTVFAEDATTNQNQNSQSQSQMAPPSDDNGTPPQPPTNSDGSVQAPPDNDGNAPSNNGGTPPEMPNGEAPSGNMGTPPDGAPNGGGQSGGVDSYTSVNEYTENTTVTGETISSTGTDENAVLVSSGEVTLDNVTINRTSSDSTGGDNASFYGVGSAVLTKGGTSYIKDANITTDADGGAGIFSYSDGVTYVADSKINTTSGASGGIHVAGGGTLYAWDLDVTTNGQSSAAIRSDRGGGTMVVDGGSYTSNGVGSPAIYCTADIAVNNATLTSTNSEAICIEGLNSLSLFDSNLTGSMKDDSQNDCTWTVIVYQSMSGDSQVGCGTFQMIGGKLTSTNGGLFYTTNTESNFVLKDVDITSSDDCEFFLKATGNSNQRGWGTSGSNGADCTFTAINQEMNGDVIWDSISTLKLYMQDKSVLTGAVIDDESNAGNGGQGTADIYVSSDSKWIVTGNSTLTNLYNEGTIVDESGNTVTIKGTDGTVYVNGTSEFTITVSSYSETADFSGAGSADSFENHQVERPSILGTSATTNTEGTATVSETSPNTAISKTLIIICAGIALCLIIMAGAVVGLVFAIKKSRRNNLAKILPQNNDKNHPQI